MKVIFLDIDGVLNSDTYAKRYHKEHLGDKGYHIFIDPDAVARILKVVQSTKSVIILSSSWRMHNIQDTIKDLASYPGMEKLVTRIIGITPRLYNRSRGDEIKSTLDRWRDWVDVGLIDPTYKDSKIDNYVILDDDNDMLDGQRDHFILVDWYKGLTDENVKEIYNILR